MLKYLCDVFRSGSTASFARWATLGTVFTGCWSVIYVVLKTHGLPDGGQLAGLGTFVVSPYAINKVAAAFDKPPNT